MNPKYFLLFLPFLFLATCKKAPSPDTTPFDPSTQFLHYKVNGTAVEIPAGSITHGISNGRLWSSPSLELITSIGFVFKKDWEVSGEDLENLKGKKYGFSEDADIRSNIWIEIEDQTFYTFQEENIEGVHFIEVTEVYEDPLPFDLAKTYRVEGTFNCTVGAGLNVYQITEGEFSMIFTSAD